MKHWDFCIQTTQPPCPIKKQSLKVQVSAVKITSSVFSWTAVKTPAASFVGLKFCDNKIAEQNHSTKLLSCITTGKQD